VKYWSKLSLGEWATKLLFLCLATDAGFIFVHLIHWQTSVADSHLFSIEADRGYAEVFQYIKEYWTVLLLGLIALQRRSVLYLSWALLFFYLLLDDSLHIHERLGDLASTKLAFSNLFSMRATELGELVISGLVGFFFLVVIAISYHFGNSKFRKISQRLIVLLLALVVFGIALDVVHSLLKLTAINMLIGLLEDGGEMLVMSVIISFVFGLLESPKLERLRQQSF
jgi:hypothetical protein